MIAIFLPSLKTLGGNRVLLDLAASLRAAGNDVGVFVVSDEGNTLFGHDAFSPFRISGKSRMPVPRALHFLKGARLAAKLSRENVVIFSEPLLAISLMLIGAQGFVRLHQADDYALFDDNPRMRSKLGLSLYKWLCQRTYRMSGITNIFVSNFVAGEYAKRGGKGQRYVARPGVNSSIFSTATNKRDGPLTIGVMARDLYWKGFADFCAAVAIAESQGLMFGEIVLIGHDDVVASFQSPFRHARPASDLELCNELQAIDIFVHASWIEGYGLPPLEAMACGCAVIVSDSGGPSEYARDGHNCLVFTPRDRNDLANKLLSLSIDHLLRAKLQMNGAITANQFSTGVFTSEFAAVLQANGHACSNS